MAIPYGHEGSFIFSGAALHEKIFHKYDTSRRSGEILPLFCICLKVVRLLAAGWQPTCGCLLVGALETLGHKVGPDFSLCIL